MAEEIQDTSKNTSEGSPEANQATPTPAETGAAAPPPAAAPQAAIPNATITASDKPYEAHGMGKVLEILGGGRQYKYEVNPETGAMSKTDVTDKAGLVKGLLAHAIVGAFAGSQERGPGATMRAFGAGGNAAMTATSEAEARQKSEAIQNAKNQQETQLNKAHIMNMNSETAHNLRNAEKLQGEILDDAVDRDSAQLAQIKELGDSSSIVAENVPQHEALAGMQKGTYKATNQLFLMSGKTEMKDEQGNTVTDPKTGEPKMEPLVTVVNNVQVPLSAEDVSRYAASGIPGFAQGQNPPAGHQVALVDKRAWDNLVHNVEISRGIAKDVGVTDEEFNAAVKEPGAINAFKAFSKYAANHDPYAALKQMETAKGADGKTPLYSGRTLSILQDAFGGKKALEYHNKLEGEAAATKEQTVEAGKKPQTLDQAVSKSTTATIAYRDNPNAATLKAAKDAQLYADNLKRSEVSKAYSEAFARIDAQKKADTDDLKLVAAELVKPDNLTSLKDVASMRGDQRLRLFAEAKKLDPNFDQGQVMNKVRFVGQFTNPNGKTMQNIASFNTFIEHAADLQDINQEHRGTQTGTKVLNTPLNKLENAFGSATYTRYVAALEPVQTEYTNALKAGFAPQASDIEAGKVILSPSSTPAQIEAAVKQMSHTVVRRADSVNQEFRAIMGRDYPDLITPDARTAANKLGLDVSKYHTGGQVNQPGSGVAIPNGATGKAPGSDGRLHYHDAQGKDLGVAP